MITEPTSEQWAKWRDQVMVRLAIANEMREEAEWRAMTSPKLEWRPIDTAEKDAGGVVLLSDGNQVYPAMWQPWGGGGFWTFLDTEVEFEPTYWMPLPGPPTNQDHKDPT